MKKSNSYYQLIPEKVFEILPEIEMRFKNISGYSFDNLKELISIIATHIRKNEDIKKNEGYWTPLKMTYLRSIIPQADKYIKTLLELGIIERSEHYQKGEVSYKYRFEQEYLSKYKRIRLTNPKLLLRIEKWQTSMKKKNSKMYPSQNKYLRQLTIDPEALNFVCKTITETDKFNYANASVIRLLNGDIYSKVDTTSGRFHSNITNIPKGLRQFLRVNGKPLINIDVTNCQPYLSIVLLLNPNKAAEFAKHCPKFTMMLKDLQAQQTEDVRLYISLVYKGELYEYLTEEFNKRGQIINNRKDVKKKVLLILFDRNRNNSKARSIFNELFPEVNRIFSLVRGNVKGSRFENFKRFAILLQRIESHIMLNIILKRINTEYPEIITLTIHDSIMTLKSPDQIETVQNIMREEFFKIVGFEPKLKIEY